MLRIAGTLGCSAHRPHQPRDRAAGDIEPLAPQLPPNLADTIDPEVGFEHAPHLDPERSIASRPRRKAHWIPTLRGMGMVG